MESKTIHLKKTNLLIEYFDSGDGDKTIFYICGANETTAAFKQVFDLLNLNYRVVSFNYPGFGESESAKKISISLYLEVIKELIEELNLKDVYLMGNSFGGYLTMKYVSTYGESNIKAIILVSPYIKPFSRNFLTNSFKVAKIYIGNLPKIENGSEPEVLVNSATLPKPNEMLRHSDLVLHTKFDINVKDLNVDTLVILGDKDPLVDTKYTKDLFKNKKNTKIEVFPNHSFVKIQKINRFSTFLNRFTNKKDCVVTEITDGGHDIYNSVGSKVLTIINNFTQNYT
jgi:pimeloyl-ACP methyl ester carboxylesterase